MRNVMQAPAMNLQVELKDHAPAPWQQDGCAILGQLRVILVTRPCDQSGKSAAAGPLAL